MEKAIEWLKHRAKYILQEGKWKKLFYAAGIYIGFVGISNPGLGIAMLFWVFTGWMVYLLLRDKALERAKMEINVQNAKEALEQKNAKK